MDQYLRDAIEAILKDAARCGRDPHDFIMYLSGHLIDELEHQFTKYCRKHGKPRKKVAS